MAIRSPWFSPGSSRRGWRSRAKNCLGVVLLSGAALVPAAAAAQSISSKPNMKAVFATVGRMHNIDQDLLEAIAQVESNGNPNAVSPKGAVGLMQLMPGTADQFSVPDGFDPVSSVLGAAEFIDFIRRRIDFALGSSDLPEVLAAYNAGPGAVEKFGGVPPYPETELYVKKVLSRYLQRSARLSAPPPYLQVRPTRVVFEPQATVVVSREEADSSVAAQLAEIKRLRARFLKSDSARLFVNSVRTSAREHN